MNNAEKWVIQNTHGQLLQSFAIDPVKIRISWYRPDAPGKTKVGEKGPLNLLAESKAQVLLMALVSQVPTEFAGAKVMTLTQALSPVSTIKEGIRPVDTRKVDIARAVIQESPPDTRFLVTEDVSFLDLNLPNQDK